MVQSNPPDRERTPTGPQRPRPPLAVVLANTRYVWRGESYDALATPDLVRDWLGAQPEAVRWGGDGTLPGRRLRAADVAALIELRDVVRVLFGAVVAHRVPPVASIETLNRFAAGAPAWPALVVTAQGYGVLERTTADPVRLVLADLARSAIGLLGGRQRDELRACRAPGCVQFFLRDHPRRQWCSTGCGNRARAARHYRRHRAG
jgi:predicted RNA-binding Zn ribbon-like protein